jgi:hypothetical protein
MNIKNKDICVYVNLFDDILEKIYDLEDCSEAEIKEYLSQDYIVTEKNDLDFVSINNKNLKFIK